VHSSSEEIEEFTNLSPGGLDITRRSSHEVFEFGEDLLDRIEVRAIGRQEDAVGASGADSLASRFSFVAAIVVENKDLARCEGRGQHVLDVQREELTIDGASALIRS
jgi:hypothetical protein